MTLNEVSVPALGVEERSDEATTDRARRTRGCTVRQFTRIWHRSARILETAIAHTLRLGSLAELRWIVQQETLLRKARRITRFVGREEVERSIERNPLDTKVPP